MSSDHTRTYERSNSIVFLKTNEAFGGLSNMAGGFPLFVSGTRIHTSEALYQACRFPHLPEVQRLIIRQTSPMTAKMKSKPHREDSRPDWDRVRLKVMRWCLRMKLAQNWDRFSELLLSTGDRPIVEESRRDDFWGAKPVDKQVLVGMNVLGRLLMELREVVKAQGPAAFHVVEPPDIPKFLFLGRPIGTFNADDRGVRGDWTSAVRVPRQGRIEGAIGQAELFDNSKLREGPAPAYPTSRTSWDRRLGELKLYPAMKDSGVPWLGMVPEHWEVTRAKNVFRCIDVRSSTGEEELLTVSSERGVVPRSSATVTMFKAESYVGYKLCWPGDLVINSLWAWGRGLGVSWHHGIVSSAYGVYRLRPKYRGYAEYVHRLVRSTPFNWELQVRSKGIWISRLQLTDEAFLGAPIPLPPVPEQSAIVRFLDHADRRIRRYIRAKQKLIKLLEEQKQAIIHRAVTRGLDPNVRLKPSGVEWLGDVPEHWEVLSLKRVARTRSGDGISSDDVQAQPTEHDSIQVIGGNGPMGYTRTANTNSGVLVIGRVGALCGNVHEVHKPVWVTDNALILSLTRDAFELRYLAAVLRTRNLNEIADRTAQPLITGTKVRAQTLPVPPLAEQTAIVEHLAQITDAIGRPITGARRKIDLLREYRTRLIADVVTGKLDVREAAARLPDEAEEPEPLDEIEAEGDADEAGADDTDEVPAEAEA